MGRSRATARPTVSVTYVIKFDIVPEKREQFMSLLTGVLDAMRSEPMFREANLHVDPENENHLMLYETWADHDDVLNVQLHRPYRQAFHAALDEMLVGPRDISIWRPLRSDRTATY
jgi:quinol monooxygenase YgiN